MTTQLRKPARDRARYSEEYKKEAPELWRNSGRRAAKVAAELGIRAPLLYRWARPKRQGSFGKFALRTDGSEAALDRREIGDAQRSKRESTSSPIPCKKAEIGGRHKKFLQSVRI